MTLLGMDSDRTFSTELLRPDFSNNLSRPRHGWFYFKEGYSSSLVREVLLSTMRSPGRVLDPFCGSGTTVVEAARWGWQGIGVEANPFLGFVARTKARSSYDVDRFGARLRQSLAQSRTSVRWRLPKDSTLVERAGLEKWLFNRAVARRFEVIRSAIGVRPKEPERQLLLLALISAMGEVANARRDGKCWRYRRGWEARRYSRIDLDLAYMGIARRYADDLRGREPLAGVGTVIEGDSRELELILSRNGIAGEFDCVLTSPPYLNSFDYTDIYRPEMLLFGSGRTSSDLRRVRFRTLRSHVQVEWPDPDWSEIPGVREVATRIGRRAGWSKRLGLMINAYFVDLETVVRQCVRRVRLGGTVGLVVAQSAYGGTVVPVDEFLAEIMRRSGVQIIVHETLREGLGNGHHQRRRGGRLPEVILLGTRTGSGQ